MLGMKHLANHTLAVAYVNEIPITNLQLQKVLFFSIGLRIRNVEGTDKLIEKTYDEPFVKWKFGPVIESLFYEYNKYKDKPITDHGKYSGYYSDMDFMIIRLLKINPYSLAKLSMNLPSWMIYEDKIINNDYVEPYTLDEIKEDFLNES